MRAWIAKVYYVGLISTMVLVDFVSASAQIAPVYSPISLEIEKSEYHYDDIIRITGSVSTGELNAAGNNLIVEAFTPSGNLGLLDQVPVLQNGSYSYSFSLIGSPYVTYGEYEVRVTFESFQTSTFFNLLIGPEAQDCNQTIGWTGDPKYHAVEAPGQEQIYVNYTGPSINYIMVNEQTNSIFFELLRPVNETEYFWESCLAIFLPTSLINSTTDDSNYNSTGGFRVLEAGSPAKFHLGQELISGRFVIIELSDGVSNVEVFGNRVIPEYPFAIMVLSLTFAALVVLPILGSRLQRK